MSISDDKLLSNIKRQAKRLSKQLSIPLRQAQSLLSISLYKCDNWNHLRDSLKSDSLDNQLLLLAALQPNADIFLFKLLDNNMNNIITRFKVNFSDQKLNEERINIIISIFGIEPSDFKSKME
ncbi:MAG TPA: hypothetical protein DEO86_06195 [Colwellia sp.]|nr:hypothetical protein [Colwellia sp.]|tara:strand:+ start:8219 stop:8587 length:369 start_codon:yes stop_codon:yes gene_type:complete